MGMEKKDAAVIKALTQTGTRTEEPLTPEQEEMLRRALDPEEQYLYDVERLFSDRVPTSRHK